MKRESNILGILIWSSLLTLIASQPVLLPSKERLVGDWVGYEAYFPDFYRVHLREDNTGVMVIVVPEREPNVYALRWEVEGQKQLRLQLSPLTKKSESISCVVSNVDSIRMDIVISGTTNKWRRTARLLNEKLLLNRMAEGAKAEMKQD